MTTMSALQSAYNAYSRYRNAKGAQIHNLTEADRMILRRLMDAGIIFQP